MALVDPFSGHVNPGDIPARGNIFLPLDSGEELEVEVDQLGLDDSYKDALIDILKSREVKKADASQLWGRIAAEYWRRHPPEHALNLLESGTTCEPRLLAQIALCLMVAQTFVACETRPSKSLPCPCFVNWQRTTSPCIGKRRKRS